MTSHVQEVANHVTIYPINRLMEVERGHLLSDLESES